MYVAPLAVVPGGVSVLALPPSVISTKFSIVITTYNRLSLLRRAVESALAQTLPCEVIVADDGSSDGTQDYVQSLSSALSASGDLRLVYHRNPINLGHCETVNVGVAIAKGDWIKLLDDDDYLAPNCLEEMANAIALYPQAVLCSCQAVQVNVRGQEVSRTKSTSSRRAFCVSQEDIHYGMLLEAVPFGTPVQVTFKKAVFLKSGGWDSTFELNYDDIDSWVKIAQYGDAVFLNQYLAYRTLWPQSGHHQLSLPKRVEKHMLIKDKIYALVPQKHRALLPNLKDIHAFVKLHQSLVGLKEGKFLTALKTSFPALFSLTAWKILIRLIYTRSTKSPRTPVRSEVSGVRGNFDPK